MATLPVAAKSRYPAIWERQGTSPMRFLARKRA